MDLTCGTRYFSAAPFILAPGKNRAERRHCSAGRSTPPRTTSFQIRRAQASLTAPAPSPTSPHRAPATTRPESCRQPPAIVAATEPSSSSSSRGQPAPATLRPNQHTGLNPGDPLLRFRPFPHGNHRRTDWTCRAPLQPTRGVVAPGRSPISLRPRHDDTPSRRTSRSRSEAGAFFRACAGSSGARVRAAAVSRDAEDDEEAPSQ